MCVCLDVLGMEMVMGMRIEVEMQVWSSTETDTGTGTGAVHSEALALLHTLSRRATWWRSPAY